MAEQRQQQLEQEQKHVAGELEKVRKRPKKLQLTPEQEAEYERIALEVEQETVQDTTALRQLEARLREAREQVAKAEPNLLALHAKREAAEVTEAKPDGPSITFPEYLRTYLDSIFEKAGALVAIEPPKIEI